MEFPKSDHISSENSEIFLHLSLNRILEASTDKLRFFVCLSDFSKSLNLFLLLTCLLLELKGSDFKFHNPPPFLLSVLTKLKFYLYTKPCLALF